LQERLEAGVVHLTSWGRSAEPGIHKNPLNS
jgi:hypothetical protein